MNLKIKNPGFWVAACLIVSIIFGFLYKFTNIDWMYYAAFAPWTLLIVYTVVAIIFAWIINPIRALITKIKEKRK